MSVASFGPRMSLPDIEGDSGGEAKYPIQGLESPQRAQYHRLAVNPSSFGHTAPRRPTVPMMVKPNQIYCGNDSC